MSYATYPPHPGLKKIIHYYWIMKADLQEAVVQDVATPLLQGMTFNLGGHQEQMKFSKQERRQQMTEAVHIFGQPLSHRVSISSQQGINIIGVKFKALGLHFLSRINMRELADKIVEATVLLGRDVTLLAERLYETTTNRERIRILNEYFLKQLGVRKKKYIDPSVEEALELIGRADGKLRIHQLQKQLPASPRTLERRFMQQLGVTPKQYARILRYNRLKILIDEGGTDWQDICYRFGYFDQSHFIKEFKLFAGRTPEDYCQHIRPLENVF